MAERAGHIKTKEDLIRATRAVITQRMDRPRYYKISPDAPQKFYETYFDVQHTYDSAEHIPHKRDLIRQKRRDEGIEE